MNVLISGLVNIETPVSVRGFPINYYPIDYPFFGVSMNVGGVGYNVAKALTALGDSITLVSYIGRDMAGDMIIKTLRSDGINAKHIQRTLEQSPQSVVLADPNGRRQIYCDLKDIQEQHLDCEPLSDDIQNADAVVCCNISFNRTLLHRAVHLGKRIATDVHVLHDINDDYNREFLEYADIVFLSDEALPCPPADFITALKNRYGMSIIVLGQGSNGAMLYERSGDRITHYDCVPCDHVVNTVGAGDALFSAFVHYYIGGRSVADALYMAQIFASHKIRYSGAATGFLTETEMNQYDSI